MKYERLEMEVIDFNTFEDFMSKGEEFTPDFMKCPCMDNGNEESVNDCSRSAYP